MAWIRTTSSLQPEQPDLMRRPASTPTRLSTKAFGCRISSFRRIRLIDRLDLRLLSPLRQRAENLAESGDTVPQFVEVLFCNNQYIHCGASLNGRVAALVGKQRHFAKIVAGLERRKEFLCAILFLQNIALACLDYVDAV